MQTNVHMNRLHIFIPSEKDEQATENDVLFAGQSVEIWSELLNWPTIFQILSGTPIGRIWKSGQTYLHNYLPKKRKNWMEDLESLLAFIYLSSNRYRVYIS